MITPRLAAVRPRVILPDGGISLLADEVASWLDLDRRGLIGIHGPQGSGRTTALAHLAGVFTDEPRPLLIDGSPLEAMEHSFGKLLICTAPVNHKPCKLWRIAPWTRDDIIEYLLAVHPAACAAVMARIDAERLDLSGRPELWRAVLDELAADPSLPGVKSALRRALTRALPTAGGMRAAQEGSLRFTCNAAVEVEQCQKWRANRKVSKAALRLLRHGPVRLLAAADRLALELSVGRLWPAGCTSLPAELIEETGERLRSNSRAEHTLLSVIAGGHKRQQPLAAGLLHAIGTGWRPATAKCSLRGANLPGVQWPKLSGQGLELDRADLTDADLSEADLQEAQADGASFSRANLHGARLTDLSAIAASFAGADLTCIRAGKADLRFANLRSARLDGALLSKALFDRADLRNARFVRAALIGASLIDALIAGADFTAADLSAARLARLVLSTANFAGARFDDAQMCECNLDGMQLPGASFLGAHLQNASLTGSRMPGGQFRDADLRGARLAEIQWEHADLRDTDLRGCTFHLGSTRCGMLDSPLASEGTRTGFYTDELEEKYFRSPEEIRKANLRGANLIGADLEGTDFYLVDLRDALYTPDQEAYLRRTGAILEVRA